MLFACHWVLKCPVEKFKEKRSIQQTALAKAEPEKEMQQGTMAGEHGNCNELWLGTQFMVAN